MAYCDKTDLLTGDIPLAGKYGDGQSFVNFAADEIDGQIGHIYISPIVFDESTPVKVAAVRPAKLLLKKINILLASGRIILDMAAGGEDSDLHAYGRSMLREGIDLLKQITTGRIELTGAPLIVIVTPGENSAVSIHQDDPYSLVEGFYTRYSSGYALPGRQAPMRPYDELPVQGA